MDPQVQALLQMMEAQSAATGAPPMYELPADVARQGAEVAFQAFNAGMPQTDRRPHHPRPRGGAPGEDLHADR
jgi:hypothetical protein